MTPQPLACQHHAIPADSRPRYHHLVHQLRAAILARTHLPNGYTYRLAADSISLAEVSEWMAFERICCPFLELQIADWTLTLTGPPGIHSILNTALPPSAAARRASPLCARSHSRFEAHR